MDIIIKIYKGVWILSGIIAIMALGNAVFNEEYTYSVLIGDVSARIYIVGIAVNFVFGIITKRKR